MFNHRDESRLHGLSRWRRSKVTTAMEPVYQCHWHKAQNAAETKRHGGAERLTVIWLAVPTRMVCRTLKALGSM